MRLFLAIPIRLREDVRQLVKLAKRSVGYRIKQRRHNVGGHLGRSNEIDRFRRATSRRGQILARPLR